MNTNASLSTTNHWLNKTTKKLEQAGVATARLDCLILLEDALGKERSWLLAHPDTLLLGASREQLDRQVERRAGYEPLAYIRGKSEFYGREFIVNAHTLEPRPETETLIQLLTELVSSEQRAMSNELVIADIGTGSGCIAITAKLEFPDAKVIACDISETCLNIARKNAEKLKADVEFYQGNLLEPVIAHCSQITALLCNLPYVPDSYHINESAMFEPRQAIFGGEDGLDLYRQLFSQLAGQKLKAKRPKYVLTESLPFQHEALASIANTAGYKLQKTDDFIQIFN